MLLGSGFLNGPGVRHQMILALGVGEGCEIPAPKEWSCLGRRVRVGKNGSWGEVSYKLGWVGFILMEEIGEPLSLNGASPTAPYCEPTPGHAG